MKRDRELLSQLLLVSACLLFVWFMSVNGLTRVPLANHDEAQTLRHIFGNSLNTPQPLQKTVTSVAEFSSQHGPLYFILLNVWSTFAGGGLFSLRLLPIFAAVLSLAVVHRLAWLSRDRHIALAAVFILAVNWLFLFQSRELRMYTLLPCLTAWIVLSYWRLLKADGRRFRWIWLSFAASTGLILYLHYFGIFVLAAIGAFHLLFVPKNRSWIHIAIALIVGAMSFIPWLPTVFGGLEGFSNKSLIGMSALESLTSIANVYANDFWFIPIGCMLLIIWRRKRLDKPQRFILILTVLMIAITLLANEARSLIVLGRLRYLLVFAPCIVSTFAIGWSLLPKLARIHLLVVCVWVIAFFIYLQNDESYIATKRKTLAIRSTPPYYSLVHQPDIEIKHSQPILSLHPSKKIAWISGDYYQKLIEPANLVHLYYDGGGLLTIQTTKRQLDSLDSFVSVYGAFWLVYNPQETSEQSMKDIFHWVRNYYQNCGRYLDDVHAVAERYVRDSDTC